MNTYNQDILTLILVIEIILITLSIILLRHLKLQVSSPVKEQYKLPFVKQQPSPPNEMLDQVILEINAVMYLIEISIFSISISLLQVILILTGSKVNEIIFDITIFTSLAVLGTLIYRYIRYGKLALYAMKVFNRIRWKDNTDSRLIRAKIGTNSFYEVLKYLLIADKFSVSNYQPTEVRQFAVLYDLHAPTLASLYKAIKRIPEEPKPAT